MMRRIKIRISKKLLDDIKKLKINGMSINEELLTLVRLGYAKLMGYNINIKYLKLEDTLEILDKILTEDKIPYSTPQCPLCDGILAHNSTNLTCLKCGSTFKLEKVKT